MQLLWILKVVEFIMQRNVQAQSFQNRQVVLLARVKLGLSVRLHMLSRGRSRKPQRLLNRLPLDKRYVHWDVANFTQKRLPLITFTGQNALELLLTKLIE
jgi:hypothetical protein